MMKYPLLGVIFLLCLLSWSCMKHGDEDVRDYRADMRTFVQEISDYGRSYQSNFIIIPQNGQELLTETGEADGGVVLDYLGAIDGIAREDLFYGYYEDNVQTPAAEQDYMIAFLDRAEKEHIEVLVIDYCWTHSFVNNSYAQSTARGYISFAAHRRELDSIPTYPADPFNENTSDISTLSEAQNFLYIINPELFTDKMSFLNTLSSTDYDLLIIDLFFGDETLTPQEISVLKTKAQGGARLVIAYMSIGEAEDYRYYWNPEWETNPPGWLAEHNPNWQGNYKVRYWDSEWQNIIFGNDSSYCKRIIDAGFDGAYLDIIDAFEYFEHQ